MKIDQFLAQTKVFQLNFMGAPATHDNQEKN
jgi:hypothetical protein